MEPLPDYATGADVLIALAALIRRLHDAAEGWVPPADAVWGAIPGKRPAGVVPLFDEAELVSHQVPAAMRRTRNAGLTMQAAAEADPVFRRWWDDGVKDRMPRAQAWLAEEAQRIDAALNQ